MDKVQSFVPHVHTSEFTEDPSDDSHGPILPHFLMFKRQNIPVDVSQSLVPQAHVVYNVFECDPSTTEQAGIGLL